MASRQEEKEARRREREAAGAAARRSEAMRKRLQLALGAVLGIGILVGAVIAVAAGGGGASEHEATGSTSTAASQVHLPEQQTANLDGAVKAAGCKLVHARSEGGGHDVREFEAADYKTNPPNSGPHTPEPAADGVYEPGNPPALGPSVHSLEHGRINVQYRPAAAPGTVAKLEALVAENGGYHMLLYENQTGMDAEVAATAWTQVLTCPALEDSTFDALRTFRDRYVDKGPERVP